MKLNKEIIKELSTKIFKPPKKPNANSTDEYSMLAISQEPPDMNRNLKINNALWKKMNKGGDTLIADETTAENLF